MRPVRASLAVICLCSATAFAQSAGEPPRIERSFETQLFEPAMGLDTYLTVEGPQVAEHLGFGVGLLMNYQHKPLVLYKKVSSGTGSGGLDVDEVDPIDVIESQMTADLVGVFGFRIKWLRAQVGVDLPINLVVMGNDIDQNGTRSGDLSASGVGDLKLQLKALIFQDLAGLSLAFSPILTFPTGKDDGFGGDPNLSFRPRVVLGYQYKDFSAAANVGYLVRQNSQIFSSEIGDQLLYGVGAGYQVHDRVIVLAELFGRAGFDTASGCYYDQAKKQTLCSGTSNSDLDAFPLETDVGTRVRLVHGLSGMAGVGFGLIRAIGSPQFRVVAGVQWAPDFRDSDKDGVYDYKDKCPGQPEDKDGFEDADGCPEPDNDEDLIPDTRDKCPTEPEDKDTYQDDDGCPEPDNDSDGIPDLKDACPFKPETKNGFSDDDGCPDVPDQDGDLVEDAKDRCPKDAEDHDKFEDLDGCPDPDNDNDGVPDKFDDCPMGPEDMDNFKDDDGCPDPDNDNDGVLDAKDKCPDEPETINGIKDDDGCPDAGKPHVLIEKGKIVITKMVFFDTNKSTIKKISFGILNEVSLVLRANPQIKAVRIEGHTDNQGNAEKNKTLSQGRAGAVKDYLVKQGIEAGRLTAAGFGQEKPIADNRTAKGRVENRRVEFVILEQADAAEGKEGGAKEGGAKEGKGDQEKDGE